MSSQTLSSAVDIALTSYQTALDAVLPALPALRSTASLAVTAGGLAAGDSAPTALLAAVLQRDQVAASWTREIATPEAIQRLSALDVRLQQVAERVDKADWIAWRQVVNPSSRRWWWWLDEAQTKTAEERDFLWVLLAGLLMTITLGLGADISARLWGGGAGGLSVVSAALTLILTGGPLTAQGRQLAVWLIDRLRLPLRYRGGTMLAAAGLFLLLAVLLRVVALPIWARVYNNRGVGLLHAGELAGAGRAFARAASINPEYAAAFYNLAVAYTDIGNYGEARSLFGQALAADRTFDLAYAGLGYVLIVQGEAEQAIPLLYTGLSLAKDNESRVALWTNLGRACLQAGRAYEAESALAQTLALDPEEAAAHCTMGLVAEELQRSPDELRLHWESCLSYADPTTPRGLELATMARAHLQTQGEGQ